MKCKICGYDFPVFKESHYIAKDSERTGLITAFGGTGDTLYDAFDCPICGCQNIAQERKRFCSRESKVSNEVIKK